MWTDNGFLLDVAETCYRCRFLSLIFLQKICAFWPVQQAFILGWEENRKGLCSCLYEPPELYHLFLGLPLFEDLLLSSIPCEGTFIAIADHDTGSPVPVCLVLHRSESFISSFLGHIWHQTLAERHPVACLFNFFVPAFHASGFPAAPKSVQVRLPQEPTLGRA